jgi:hypothetical protein
MVGSEYFKGYHGENVLEILDLSEPEKIKKKERTDLRLTNESECFSAEYFMYFILFNL